MDGWMQGCNDEWMNTSMDRWTNEWMHGGMDEFINDMNVWMDKYIIG